MAQNGLSNAITFLSIHFEKIFTLRFNSSGFLIKNTAAIKKYGNIRVWNSQ